MTTGNWAFILVTLGGTVIIALFWVTWHLAFKDGHEAGRQHERNRHHEWQVQESRAAAAVPDQWDRWLRDLSAGHGERLAATAELPRPAGRHDATARPRPARTSLVSGTSELRAIESRTDAWIADMEAQEAAYRREITS